MTNKQSISKSLLSYAGEYLVAARLSLMGYLAVVTPKGAPEVDNLVYDFERKRSTTIQVKTIRGENVPLGIRVTMNNIDEKLKRKVAKPYVIVHVKRDDWRASEFYIVPAKDLREIAKRGYIEWLNRPYHKKPKEELEKTPQPLLVRINDLRQYLEKWENIWKDHS